VLDEPRRTRRGRSHFIRTHLAGIAGALILSTLAVVSVLAPWISPYDPLYDTNMSIRYQGPSRAHLFGTDQLGRDILSRVIWGARISLLIGLAAVGIGGVSGTVAGLVSGYRGGAVDVVVMRFVDILLSFPFILLAILLAALFRPGLGTMVVAVGVAISPKFCRISRASTLSETACDYVLAARAIGASDLRICFRHVLPNTLAPLLVTATYQMATAILTESSLSFLGLGVPPPTATWGTMIEAGRAVLRSAPWLVLFPGMAIFLTIFGFNLLGDWLRDHLDPRLRGVL
jgi:peptide/nickel transport system permease protein